MLRNKEQKEQLRELGYFKTSLLNNEEVEELIGFYNVSKSEAEVDKKFYTSIWSDNKAHKSKVDQKIKSILLPKLESILNDFKPAFSNYMVKLSGEDTQLQPHQDWSFVKEPEHHSITIWIPLKDVDKRNGALEVFPKSHLLKNYVRARFMNSPFNEHIDFIEKNAMKSISMKKGEALFINSRTIHSSPPNLSDEERIAVSIVVLPKKAEMIHYVQDKDNAELIHQLKVDEQFFIDYSAFDYPDISNAQQREFVDINPLSLSDIIDLKNR